MFRFETLEVWKKAKQMCSEVLEDVKKLPTDYRFTIGSNLIRAAISVPNNIAEGSGRRSSKESSNFYNIARGSVYEVINVAMIMKDKQLMNNQRFDALYTESEEICRMLTGLMK